MGWRIKDILLCVLFITIYIYCYTRIIIIDISQTTVEVVSSSVKPCVYQVEHLVYVEPDDINLSTISDEDISLMALITMAEAEGSCEQVQRLVISTILNRMCSSSFPNTVSEVIYQPNQFTPILNGRLSRCEVRENYRQLVIQEIQNRTSYDVIYFTKDRYSKYGVPLCQIENVCFSSYN